MGPAVIVVTEADCFDPDASSEETVNEYSEDEISEAIANRTLTDDQAWYLHTQGISWQVQVR